MEVKKTLLFLNFVLLLILAISMIFFFIGSTSTFNLNYKLQIYLLVYLIFVYALSSILILKSRRRIIEINKKRIIKKIVEKPKIKEIIKKVYIGKKEPQKKRFKYYASTLTKTYHLERCRFSGMIKKENLILRNKNIYFKKNKFHACKNCNPNKR